MMRIKVTIKIQDGTTWNATNTIEREQTIDLEQVPFNNDHGWRLSEAIFDTLHAITRTDEVVESVGV